MPRPRKFAAWGRQELALAGLDGGGLRGLLLDDSPPIDYSRRDQVLAALVRLARSDSDAMVLLIGCLLPGLRARLARHGWGLEREEAEAIAVEALCRRLQRYPLDRRPRRIAMNLLLDTTHDLIDARKREQAYRERVQHFGQITVGRGEEAAGLSPDLLWHEARRAGVLSDRELALVRVTYTYDLPIGTVAPLVGMGAEAAGKARRRAVLKLRAWAAAAEDAA